MERNTLRSDLKHHGIGGRSMKDHINIINNNNHNNNHKLKDHSWEYSTSEREDLLSGLISWPPRSYTCSFCKREFRSAQALGGHMNVHRRDRARLRAYSPPKDGQYPFLNLNLNPTPTPNDPPPSQPSSPTKFLPFLSPLSTLSSSSSASLSEMRKWVMEPFGGERIKSSKTLFKVREFVGVSEDGECEGVKRGEIVRLDLEIGLVSDSKECLDLELRLGQS